MKTPRTLMFALICGLIAAISLFGYIQGRERFWDYKYGSIPVLIAAKTIERYQVIDETMVKIKNIPKDFVQPQAISADKLGAVINYMADATIPADTQLTEAMVALPGESRISVNIPEDSRACTVAINEVSGVAGLIRPFDRVDVLGTFKTVEEKTRIATHAETAALFQNVQVLAVGRNYLFEGRSALGNKDKSLISSVSSGTSSSNVTLLMSPRDCMDLTVAQQVGVITLTLRSWLKRGGGKTFHELKDQHSTSASVTGIRGAMEISSKPKWLEIRGEQTSLVP